jgi:hypothetical protein
MASTPGGSPSTGFLQRDVLVAANALTGSISWAALSKMALVDDFIDAIPWRFQTLRLAEAISF